MHLPILLRVIKLSNKSHLNSIIYAVTLYVIINKFRFDIYPDLITDESGDNKDLNSDVPYLTKLLLLFSYLITSITFEQENPCLTQYVSNGNIIIHHTYYLYFFYK